MTPISESLRIAAAHISAFRKEYSSTEQILVAIGLAILPKYLFQNNFAVLIKSIQVIGQGGNVNLFGLFFICLETVLIIYTCGTIIQYFWSAQEIKTQETKKYKGVHPCIEYSVIPRHLVAPPIIPEDDTTFMEEELSAPLPSLDDLLNNTPLPEGLSDSQSVFEHYNSMYGVDANPTSQKEDETNLSDTTNKIVSAYDYIKQSGRLEDVLNSLD